MAFDFSSTSRHHHHHAHGHHHHFNLQHFRCHFSCLDSSLQSPFKFKPCLQPVPISPPSILHPLCHQIQPSKAIQYHRNLHNHLIKLKHQLLCLITLNILHGFPFQHHHEPSPSTPSPWPSPNQIQTKAKPHLTNSSTSPIIYHLQIHRAQSKSQSNSAIFTIEKLLCCFNLKSGNPPSLASP